MPIGSGELVVIAMILAMVFGVSRLPFFRRALSPLRAGQFVKASRATFRESLEGRFAWVLAAWGEQRSLPLVSSHPGYREASRASYAHAGLRRPARYGIVACLLAGVALGIAVLAWRLEPASACAPALHAPGPVAWSIAVIGLAFAALTTWRLAARARSRWQRESAWLGERVVVRGPALESLDGRRRIRRCFGEAARRVDVWEELDADGHVVATHRAPGPSTPGPGPGRRSASHRLAIPTDSARHFAGEPTDPSRRALGVACELVLDERADGFVLSRRDRAGSDVGETWHPTRAAALAQMLDEYGLREPSGFRA